MKSNHLLLIFLISISGCASPQYHCEQEVVPSIFCLPDGCTASQSYNGKYVC